MRVIPLAFESLGTRGMCTSVETTDANILIDPGVNLAPERFGLPPHPVELERKREHWEEIESAAAKSDILVVTHYHFDHVNPEGLDVFKSKVALLKDPHQNVNYNQMQRAREIIPVIKPMAAEVHYADGAEFEFGSTCVTFSPAVHHGTHPRVFTVQVSIVDGEDRLVHTSDVVGAELDEHLDFILKMDPVLVIVDGPNFSVKTPSIDGIVKILNHTSVETVIVEHHLLRDERWKEQIAEVYRIASSKNVRVVSAAEYMGKQNDLLEARRRELYADFPMETDGKTEECQ